MSAIFSHRSIRKFSAKKVDEATIQHILEAAVRASNTGNMQAYSIVVTRSTRLLEQLEECHFHQPASKAPVQLTFCADFNRFTKWCEQRKATPGFGNFQSFIVGMTDALLAAQNCSIQAVEEGLGICYLGTCLYSAERIIELLKLPKGVVPVATVVMGYPDESPELTDRLPLEGVVHYDTYTDYTAADIDRIYADKEALPFTKHLLEINSKETLAQIFTDNRYPKATNERISTSFLEVLRRQGFLSE